MPPGINCCSCLSNKNKKRMPGRTGILFLFSHLETIQKGEINQQIIKELPLASCACNFGSLIMGKIHLRHSLIFKFFCTRKKTCAHIYSTTATPSTTYLTAIIEYKNNSPQHYLVYQGKNHVISLRDSLILHLLYGPHTHLLSYEHLTVWHPSTYFQFGTLNA